MTKKEKSVPFEKAMDRLETIVNQLEDGELSLDKSLDSFEEGMQLAKQCEDQLLQAEGRVEKIMKEFNSEKTVTLSDDELDPGV